MIKQIAVSTLLATSALAQSHLELEDKLKAEMTQKMVFISAEGMPESMVAGAPYSADETNTTTQTLFDGNRIVHTSATKVYRDQQGRTRIERTLSGIGPVTAAQPTTRIAINDPVAGVMYTLDAEARTAYKVATQNSGSQEAETLRKLKQMTEDLAKTKVITDSTSAPAAYTTAQRVEKHARREELGISNMSGVAVKGTRSTIVIPAGAEGNEREIDIVDERWYSPDLKMNIMTKHSDPRSGETVFQVNNLSRSNPDLSLFQVPADYQIKDGPQRIIKFDTVKE